ncbi:hypothetical protein IJD44_07625 [bacterium]|nr:hypothetical protein [bacterium]
MSTDLLIIRNRNKLEKLIEENADYKLILRQSKRLDMYINRKMKELRR